MELGGPNHDISNTFQSEIQPVNSAITGIRTGVDALKGIQEAQGAQWAEMG